jgi:inorganic pyrophosphatase
VPSALAGDGEEQDAYILGVDKPVDSFDGVVVAILHRENDVEDKWVVAPEGVWPTDGEILEKTFFTERYFTTVLKRK